MQLDNIFTTNIYDKFKCSADKCPITCCGQWKIDVDDDAFDIWKDKNINLSAIEIDGRRVIALDDKKMCPALERGLCSLVCKYGDEVISKTCQIFPRQDNDFETCIEKNVVICCPEVIDMLGALPFNYRKNSANELFSIRDKILDIILDDSMPLEKAMMVAFFYLLNNNIDDELSYAIDNIRFVDEDTFYECNEIFLDITENYRKEGLYSDFLDGMDGCDFYIDKAVLKEYETLFRKVIASEIYSNLYLPEYDEDNIIVAFEWIILEYVTIRQAILMKIQLGEPLSYELVRKCIVFVARMMGYDEEDITEYMYNSFEEIIWEWGYLALIVGRPM